MLKDMEPITENNETKKQMTTNVQAFVFQFLTKHGSGYFLHPRYLT